MKKHLILTTALSSIFLSGCTAVGPDYRAPDIKTHQEWFSSEASMKVVDKNEDIDTKWWEIFKDETLNEFIKEAVAHNLDIKIAEANIRTARALRETKKAGFYPSLDLGAKAAREVMSTNNGFPVNLSLGGTKVNPRTTYSYETGFDSSWEIDLFGGTRRSVEAANARLEATIEKRHDILLSVMAEVARNYAELRGVQLQISNIQQNIDLEKKTVSLILERHKAGDSNKFDLARSEAQLIATEAALPNLTADMRSNIYRLSVLTGQEPQALLNRLLKQSPLPILPDIVPVGLRSDILRRRPDIRQAERQLAAETADIGVAKSDLFPKFFLTGSAGLQSLSFGDLFQSTSGALSLGPSIQWPIFKGGEISARIKAKESSTDAAALNYEKAVLSALEDAETALVRYGQELETRKKLEIVVTTNQDVLNLAIQRYESGETDLLDLLDAERHLIKSKNDLALSETRTVTNLISLYKALGGGWEGL